MEAVNIVSSNVKQTASSAGTGKSSGSNFASVLDEASGNSQAAPETLQANAVDGNSAKGRRPEIGETSEKPQDSKQSGGNSAKSDNTAADFTGISILVFPQYASYIQQNADAQPSDATAAASGKGQDSQTGLSSVAEAASGLQPAQVLNGQYVVLPVGQQQIMQPAGAEESSNSGESGAPQSNTVAVTSQENPVQTQAETYTQVQTSVQEQAHSQTGDAIAETTDYQGSKAGSSNIPQSKNSVGFDAVTDVSLTGSELTADSAQAAAADVPLSNTAAATADVISDMPGGEVPAAVLNAPSSEKPAVSSSDDNKDKPDGESSGAEIQKTTGTETTEPQPYAKVQDVKTGRDTDTNDGTKSSMAETGTKTDLTAAGAVTQAGSSFQTVLKDDMKTQNSTIPQSELNRTADAIAQAAQSGRSELRIHLSPEDLGGINIRIVSQNGAVSVRITADNEQTSQLLAGNVNELNKTIQQQGVTMNKTEVYYAGENSDYGSSGFSQNSGAYSQQNGSGQWASAAAGSEESETQDAVDYTVLDGISILA